MNKSVVLTLVSLVLLVGASGFADHVAPEPAPLPPTYTAIKTYIFDKHCVGCHESFGPRIPAAGGIDLTSYDAMMASNDDKTNTRFSPFIKTASPDQSRLYTAVKNGIMPKHEGPGVPVQLQDHEVTAILDWIEQGAKNN